MIILDLDRRYDHRIYTYDRIKGNKCLVLCGVSAEQQGNYQVTMDSTTTRNQTVVVARGDDYEIVIELRPRKLTEIERIKLK